MNKNIAMLILSVVLLAMILIVLNQWAFGPSSANREGADFSDILKKSSVVKVPAEAPGVRIPVAATGNASVASAAPGTPAEPSVPAPMEAQDAAVVPHDEGMNPSAGSSAEVKTPLSAPALPVVPSAAPKPSASQVAAKPAPAIVQQPAPKPVKAAAAKSAVVPSGPNRVETMTLRQTGNGAVLEITAAAPFTYKVFGLKQPQRVVVDLAGTFAKVAAPSVNKSPLVTGVRVGRHEKSVRIVMDVAGAAVRDFDAVQPAGNTLRIIVK